jgi:hypothetical protein
MDQPLKKRRRGEVKPLPADNLATNLDFAISSQGSAENAMLYLIEHYDFDLDQLKATFKVSVLPCSRFLTG